MKLSKHISSFDSLPRLSAAHRGDKTETNFWKEFNELQAGIRGGELRRRHGQTRVLVGQRQEVSLPKTSSGFPLTDDHQEPRM